MENSVCFIGHRKVKDTPQLRESLRRVLIKTIENGSINFIFGDHSEFNDICYETVTELKELYQYINRIKFRKNYEHTDDYTFSLLKIGYEDTIAPKGITNAGKSAYAERNQAMIIESEICIFYYDESYLPPKRKRSKNDLTDYQPKSGTALAYIFALKRKKKIYNIFNDI